MSFHILNPETPVRPLVLMSGWAMDYRVFGPLNITARPCVVTDSAASSDSHHQLAAFLRSNAIGPVAILGWSLGGHCAVAFSRAYPELTERLVLVGMRPTYPADIINASRERLRENPRQWIEAFYRQCFLPSQKRDYRWFRSALEQEYLRSMDPDTLQRQLDILESAELALSDVIAAPTLLVQGAADSIAPVSEIRSLAAESVRVIQDAGHAAFLSPLAQRLITEFLVV